MLIHTKFQKIRKTDKKSCQCVQRSIANSGYTCPGYKTMKQEQKMFASRKEKGKKGTPGRGEKTKKRARTTNVIFHNTVITNNYL